jgi:hypothetical protein
MPARKLLTFASFAAGLRPIGGTYRTELRPITATERETGLRKRRVVRSNLRTRGRASQSQDSRKRRGS